MLDGILGRGFTVKCKSLLKTTRTRIEVVRKRAEAKQRFLKEDLAKLLSNGLDINAYGRTEEYIAGMNLLACYDYLDQSCDYILKQLSRMQKLEECPEECKEVVAALMYAAARFSDLPELRDLRDTFQERYEAGLEVYVNQKFVEKLSSRSPTTEKKVRVLRDIASEFSIKWDSKGFEKRMAAPSVGPKADVHKKAEIPKQKHGPPGEKHRHGLLDEKSNAGRYGEGNVGRRDEAHLHMAGRKDAKEHREKSLLKNGGSNLVSQGENDVLFHGRHSPSENNNHLYPVEKDDRELKAEKSNSSSRRKLVENVDAGDARLINGIPHPRENVDAVFYKRAEFGEHAVSYENSNSDKTKNSLRKDLEVGSPRMKAPSDCPLPPPYVKSKDRAAPPPYMKRNEDKHRYDKDTAYAAGSDLNGHCLDNDSSNRINKVKSLGRSNSDYDNDRVAVEQSGAPARAQSYGHENDFDYQEANIPLRKPRSHRKKYQRSSSADAPDDPEDANFAKTSSSSRRKDHHHPSRKGLQVLFDEDHHRKDDEERMIDKLLLHYSKKPSNYDPGKSREKVPSQSKISDAGESSTDRSRDVLDKKHEAMPPPPPRSMSLPPEQTPDSPPPATQKVYARANSFQPDNQVKHVHPKLPDYDDLAARFAALKGR